VTLAALAGDEIELGDEELRAATRRALFVLAAGGDPGRGLDVNGPAVASLAAELESTERGTALAAGLERLRGDAAGLPHVSEAIHGLIDAPGTAWRAYACSLLAERLADD
jgi:hypothetical protein